MTQLPASPTSTVEAWSSRIRSSLERSVEAILDTGRLLQAAKDELPHGQFLVAVELAGLSPRMTQMFLSVAANVFSATFHRDSL